ncbi:hypothetical protein Ntsu_32170 [Nocardia sp. IFM 10818]
MHPCGEYRCGVEQFGTHPGPLRTLTGKDEYNLARGVGRTLDHGRVRGPVRQRLQPGEHLGVVTADHDRSVGQRGA